MNIRLTPEDILAFYQKYGKLPDTHLFASEDLKEFFTLLHLVNHNQTLSSKSKEAIWKKTQGSLKLPRSNPFNFGNIFKVCITALVSGTALFFVTTYITDQSPLEKQLAFNETNKAIDSLLEDLDTSYIDENSSFQNQNSNSIHQKENGSESSDSQSRVPSFFESLRNKKNENPSENNQVAINPPSNNNEDTNNNGLAFVADRNTSPSNTIENSLTPQDQSTNNTQPSQQANPSDSALFSPNELARNNSTQSTPSNTEATINTNNSTPQNVTNSNSSQSTPATTVARNNSLTGIAPAGTTQARLPNTNPNTSSQINANTQTARQADPISISADQATNLKSQIPQDESIESIVNDLIYLSNLTF